MNGNCSYLKIGFKKIIWILGLFLLSVSLFGQKKKQIDIINSDIMAYNKQVVENAQRLIGHVQIKHNDILMWCDSAYKYNDKNAIDAFGNVHILRGDTLNLYADYIKYNGDDELAKARQNVRLINKEVLLITDSLDYDMKKNIGYYQYGGTVKDSTNMLESVIGQYYGDTETVYFKDSVKVTSDEYLIFSDTLIYETQTKKVFLVGPTKIISDSDTLYTEYGMYNSVEDYGRLTKNPRIWNEDRKIIADSIFYNKQTGEGLAFGNAWVEDFTNRVIVQGNKIEYNEQMETACATDRAVFVQCSETDSLFLHADTLRTCPDTTTAGEKLILAYYGVKFFRTDMQGKCDSLVYWSKDSTIQMFTQPVIWSNNNQLSSSYIEVLSKSPTSNEVNMKDDAFIISMDLDSSKYNQIKGKNMTGYIRQNELYKIDVDGNGQSVYYTRDDNGIFGLNKAESSNIIIYLKKGKVHQITFVQSCDGELKPLGNFLDGDQLLPGFNWQEDLRPKNKYDIFQVPVQKVSKD